MSHSKTVAIGSDHGGFRLKETLKVHLRDQGHEISDCGTFGEKSIDYPDIAGDVARKVSDKTTTFGIIIDGAGIGSAMVANKFPGVRAALCYDVSSAKNAREHNDANILTLGAGLIGSALAIQIADTFLSHECTAERHLNRVKKINLLDKSISTDTSSSDSGFGDTVLSNFDLSQIARRVSQLLNETDISAAKTESPPTDNCTDNMICNCGICVE